MSGITAYGAYIPAFRLSRDSMAAAWGRRSLGGERSVANNDEETATIAVEAAIDCLNSIDRRQIDGLFFASTTLLTKKNRSSSLVATAVDLGDEITQVDFGNSFRAGTNAMKMAYNSIKSGGGAEAFLLRPNS